MSDFFYPQLWNKKVSAYIWLDFSSMFGSFSFLWEIFDWQAWKLKVFLHTLFGVYKPLLICANFVAIHVQYTTLYGYNLLVHVFHKKFSILLFCEMASVLFSCQTILESTWASISFVLTYGLSISSQLIISNGILHILGIRLSTDFLLYM